MADGGRRPEGDKARAKRVREPSALSVDTGRTQLCIQNDNKAERCLRVEVLIPADLPVSQAEIEVIAALLEDWDSAPNCEGFAK